MKILEWKNSEAENLHMLELIQNVFSEEEKKTSSFFHWQYNKNPQGKALIVLCIDEDKNDSIVGQEPIIPMALSVDEKDVQGSLSINSVVHSSYRGKGIFSKLVDSLPELGLKRGISCVYGIPNTKSYNAFLKQGWFEIVKLPLLVRPLNFSYYFNNSLKKILNPFDSIWKIKGDIQSSSEEYHSDFTKEFDHLTSKLYKIKNGSYRFSVKKAISCNNITNYFRIIS